MESFFITFLIGILLIMELTGSSPRQNRVYRSLISIYVDSPWVCILILTPDRCHFLSCAGGKPQWGYFYRAFQGYKTGRRGSRIVKVTQSAAKVVTGVSVSLSCAERGTRLRCGLLNIYFMSHRRRHVVCSIKWYATLTFLQSCHVT